MRHRPNDLFLVVLDRENQSIEHCSIEVQQLEKNNAGRKRSRQPEIATEYAVQPGVHRVHGVVQGQVNVTVSAPGYRSETRRVPVSGESTTEVFILGHEDDLYLYDGNRRRFFPKDFLIAVDAAPDADPQQILAIADRNVKARRVAVDRELEQRHGVMLLQIGDTVSRDDLRRLRSELKRGRGAHRIRPVLHVGDNSMMLLNEHATVEFNPDVDESTILQTLDRLEVKRIHPVGGLPGHYIVGMKGDGDAFDMLEACNMLVESGIALTASPGATSTIRRSQIYPVSFLRPLQYHLGVAKLYQAWERLRIYSRDVLGVAITDNDDITYGRSDVIISIMDDGLPSEPAPGGGIRAIHPNFQGNVKGAPIPGAGMEKVYRFFNFRHRDPAPVAPPATAPLIQMVPNNHVPEGSHGIHCSGVATALTNLNEPAVPPGAVVMGVVGAIPNARIIAAIDSIANNPMTNYHHFRAWEWLTGLDPGWVRSAAGGLYHPLQFFPDVFGTGTNPGPGAGLNSFSGTFGGPAALVADRQSMAAVLNSIAWWGRNRRGGFFFQAAANNDQDIINDHMVADHRRMIVVGASALDHNNMEIRAPYSDFHTAAPPIVPLPPDYFPKPEIMGGGAGYNIGLEFSAPSHTHYQAVAGGGITTFHDPPRNRGVFSTGLTGPGNDSDVPGSAAPGGLPQIMTLQAPVAAPAAVGGPFDTITVDMPVGAPIAAIGDFLLIGDPAGGNITEAAQVQNVAPNPAAVPPNAVITLTESMRNAHPLPCNVHFGPAQYTDAFGGTSSAAPLVAGIAGLVISARPTLTNVEVREIMRQTAAPIDLKQGYRGVWRGTEPANVNPPNTPANPLLDLVNPNGLFVLRAPNSTLAAPTAAGATTITVPAADLALFRVRQAILIGAETRNNMAAGPSVPPGTPVDINVDSIDGFVIGHSVRVGASYSTFLSGVFVASTDVHVGNTRGFRANDQVMIGGVPYNVLAIVNSQLMTLNAAPPAPVAYPINPPIEVTLRRSELCTITNIFPAAPGVSARIQVNALLHAHPVGDIIEVEGSETTVVKGFGPGPQDLIVEPLVFNHPIAAGAISVRGGLMPFYSPALGFGRVDADAAVQAALGYDHEARDLMIRNHLNDNGHDVFVVAPATPVNSPDLWIRNTAPAADPNPNPAGYPAPASSALAGPHQNPSFGADRWIYARVHNRGNALESLDAAVRFYICLKNQGAPAPTIDDFSQTVLTIVDGAGQPIASDNWRLTINSTDEGTEYLGESYVYASVGLLRGIAPGATYIANFQWPVAITPPPTAAAVPAIPLADRMRVYLLAEITPHDGIVHDPVRGALNDSLIIGENNNFTYKEISFAEIEVLDVAGAQLPRVFNVPHAGVAAPYRFDVHINDQFGYFVTENIRIEVTIRPAGGGAPITQSYRHDAVAGWVFDPPFPAPPPAPWLVLNPPQLNSTIAAVPPPAPVAAAGVQAEVFFTGSLTIGNAADQISIRVLIDSESGAQLTDNSIAAAIRPTPVEYSDDEIRGIPGLGLFAFADMAALPVQNSARTFGPTSETTFRLTSGFEPVSDVPVYAPVSGMLLVQRVSDGAGGYLGGVVNVVIKPSERTFSEVPSLEYVVLRGVRFDSFFAINTTTSEIEVRGSEGASELVSMIYQHQNARLQAFRANATLVAEHPELEPDDTINVEMFGWLPNVDPETRLDEYFNGRHRTIQLAYVPAGMHIGHFAAAADVGVEFIAEGGVFIPRLEDMREPEHVIDFTQAPYDTLTGLAAKHAREQVLSFIDPAAYYGSHTAYGVRKRNGTGSEPLQGIAVYDDIVARFATRNTLYLDVRNENNYSLTYYGNYNPEGVQLRVGASSVALSETQYGTLGWPLRIMERSSAQIAEGDAGRIYVALPTMENKRPLVHASAGALLSVQSSRTAMEEEIYIEGVDWSRELALRVHQIDDGIGDMLDVASLIRLHYGRRVDTGHVWEPNSTAPKYEYYTDNLFGPIGTEDHWEVPADTTRWVNLRDRLFVDGTVSAPVLDFESVVERGVAFQEGQVVLFNAALDIRTDDSRSFSALSAFGSASGGFSVQPNFAEAAAMLSRMRVLSQEVKDTPSGGGEVTVALIRLVPEQKPLSANAFMMLGVSQPQYELLKDAAGTLSPYHHRNLVLEKDNGPGAGGAFTDADILYHRYTVKVRGLNASGISTDAAPSQAIKVYSMDGLTFVSAAFEMPELVPPIYIPDHEEARSLGTPGPWERIKADPTIRTDFEQFDAAVKALTEPRPSAKSDLQNLIRTYGKRILDHARATSKTIRDDRPLYWARLRMAVALKEHWYCLANKVDCDALAAELEDISRGRGLPEHSGVDFSSAGTKKKILISGFDPFELDDPLASNPSGAVALALHGETLTSPDGVQGYVQSVLFPVRYRDFDAGVIEKFFTKYLYDDEVDMIVTLSKNGASSYYDIERFASRYRNPNLLDNDDQHGASPIGVGTGWNEFYETNLPVKKMMSAVDLVLPPVQTVFYDQSFQSSGGAGGVQEKKHPSEPTGPNLKENAPGVLLSLIEGRAMRGSGGTYLSNEIFYRVARLRDQPPAGASGPSGVRTGHLHIPGVAEAGTIIDDIVTATMDLLARGLDGLVP